MLGSLFSTANFKVSTLIIVFLAISARRSVARKCVCTSKACREAGVETCRTRFSCYTEEMYDVDGTSRDNTSTRGCTEGATPLLCESNAWIRSSRRGAKLLQTNPEGKSRQELVWPKLKCCDTHDYCNSIVTDRGIVNHRAGLKESLVKSSKRSKEMESEKYEKSSTSVPIESATRSGGSTIQDRETGPTRTIVADFEDRERSYDPLGHRIGPLHVAVLVLAVAALTSVLGACYVITRFLRSPSEIENA
ncbi:uncharacterized protein [Venturia canescens]|uniref:uncharacterized protein isoform X2 n=1 Tax=Venturia canescens TaxID=32260 RepID=UPI001C9C6223|nr:uncharacterized protein LOC122408565 isoform X2 [Venturia canescens]